MRITLIHYAKTLSQVNHAVASINDKDFSD